MKRLILLSVFILSPYIAVWGQNSYYMDNGYAIFREHPKAKGLDFKIKVPNGWILEEGTRPNVVCKLTQGTSSFIIIIRQNVTFFSRNQGKKFMDSEGFAERYLESSGRMVDPKIVSVTNTIVDTYPAKAFEIQYKMHVPVINQMYDFQSYLWAVCYEDLLISMHATALQKDFQSLSVRFYDILQNIVFLEHYEK
jgi:hypothetical protein